MLDRYGRATIFFSGAKKDELQVHGLNVGGGWSIYILVVFEAKHLLRDSEGEGLYLFTHISKEGIAAPPSNPHDENFWDTW